MDSKNQSGPILTIKPAMTSTKTGFVPVSVGRNFFQEWGFPITPNLMFYMHFDRLDERDTMMKSNLQFEQVEKPS